MVKLYTDLGGIKILKLLLVIPTLNEAKSIRQLLQNLEKLEESFDVLIVDDDSSDETIFVVNDVASKSRRSIKFIVRRNVTDGLAGAYLRGYIEAANNNYTHVLQMDGDGQHQAEDIPNLIWAAKKGGYVIGSRYCENGRTVGWSPSRLLISRFGNLYFTLLFSSGTKDSTGGFRLASVADLQIMWRTPPTSHGFTFHAESTYRALVNNLKVVEAPIIFVSRNAGDSKMSLKSGFESLKLMTTWRFLNLKTNA